MTSSDTKDIPLEFRPGVNNQNTAFTAQGTWFDSNRIRFCDGRPESWRGWLKKSTNTIDGTPRASVSWQDQLNNAYAAFGSECGLWAFYGGMTYDLTPVRTSVYLSAAFSVSASSSLVLVSSPLHGLNTGDRFLLTGVSATIGGNVFVSGAWSATTVVGVNSFYFAYGTVAVSTSLNTGRATALYLIGCGASSTQGGYGWGIGVWGHAAGWGVGVSTSSITSPMRMWFVDNWGVDLVASYRRGPIYYWQTNTDFHTQASLVAGAPSQNNYILVSPNSRQLISFGGVDIVTSVYDPLLVQWSDQESPTTWFPTPTNTAGGIRLAGGYKLMGARRSRNQINIWTDDALHSMSFTGPPFNFSFRQIGDKCGLIGPNAHVDLDGVTYWMSTHAFYKYDGRVTELSSTVAKYVFNDLTPSQFDKILVGSNKEFNEIIFLYPSADSNEVDSYALYDISDNAWSIGRISFTMWNDRGAFRDIMTGDSTGYVYDHDVEGYYLGDGSPLESFIQSGDLKLGDSDLMFADRFIPDFTMPSDGAVQVSFYVKNFPNSDYIVKGPYIIGANTLRINPRIRGRFLAYRIDTASTVPDTNWQYGAGLLSVQPDGKR